MDDRAQTYVDASKRIVDELVKQGKPVPEELVQTQWILEMWCNNADRIAKSLTDSRRRKSGDDLSTIEQLLREQDKYMSQVQASVILIAEAVSLHDRRVGAW